MNINQKYREAISNYPQGFTMDRRCNVVFPSNGYAIGVQSFPDVASLVQSDSEFLGYWQEDGQEYFDAVAIIQDREKAVSLARERGEIAVYDFENRVSIFV